jgi:hypothetical protein
VLGFNRESKTCHHECWLQTDECWPQTRIGYSIVRRGNCELRSNTSSARTMLVTPPPRLATQQEGIWKGPWVMGSLCGKNHMPESCSIFDKLSPKGRLAIIQMKQLCQFCYNTLTTDPAIHSHNRPAPSVDVCECITSCRMMHCRRRRPELW